MRGLEWFGYVCLALIALVYAGAMLLGVILAFPWGLLGLVALVGFGALFIKVLAERLGNREDDHYSRSVDQ